MRPIAALVTCLAGPKLGTTPSSQPHQAPFQPRSRFSAIRAFRTGGTFLRRLRNFWIADTKIWGETLIWRGTREKIYSQQHHIIATMPVITRKSEKQEAPQQPGQKSRKGKKAWRKNVDIKEVEAGVEAVRDEVIKGCALSLLLRRKA